jgi:hypothetical protein
VVFSHSNRPLNETKDCGGGFFLIQQANKTKKMKALFWNEKGFSLGLNDFEKKGVWKEKSDYNFFITRNHGFFNQKF